MATMQLPCGVTEIDIDEDAKMSEKYAIRGVPTLVAVDDTGTELGRLVGAKPAGMVQAWITKVTA
jgi:thioredoxin-like negative regulator of GroEL